MDVAAEVGTVGEGLFADVDGAVHLIAGECGECGEPAFPRVPVCPACQSQSIRDHALPRTGQLYSFTVVRSRPPGYAGPVPYGLGLVELAGRIRVSSMIVAEDFGTLQIGAPVELVTVDVGEREPLLSFAFRETSGDERG